MRYLLIILLFISFNSAGQSRYPGRTYNFAMVDTADSPNTMLYWVSMDSARAALGVLAVGATTSVSRSFNSNFQPSASRASLVRYSVEISCALTLSGGQSGTVFLEYSADGSTGWTEAGRFTNTNTGAVIVGVSITNTNAGQITGLIPTAYYVRLRTTGTATITYRSGQETIL